MSTELPGSIIQEGMCCFKGFKSQPFPYHQGLPITLTSDGYILLFKQPIGVISCCVVQEETIQLMREERGKEGRR